MEGAGVPRLPPLHLSQRRIATVENLHCQNSPPAHDTPAQVIEVPAVSVTPIQIPPVVLTPDQTLCYMAGSASAAERERKRHRDMTICGSLDALDLVTGW